MQQAHRPARWCHTLIHRAMSNGAHIGRQQGACQYMSVHVRVSPSVDLYWCVDTPARRAIALQVRQVAAEMATCACRLLSLMCAACLVCLA